MDIGKDYLKYLADRTSDVIINEKIKRLTTPLFDSNNDAIELYIIDIGNGKFKITDDQETMNSLLFNGVDVLKSDMRKALIKDVLNGFGINMNDNKELFIESSESKIPQNLYFFSQAIIRLSDLAFTSKTKVRNFFYEDVKSYLDSKEVPYIEDAGFVGKTGFTTKFDFSLPHSKKAPEKLIKVTNRIDTGFVKTAIFGWEDVKQTRPSRSIHSIVYNDAEHPIKPENEEALKRYDIIPIAFSKIDTLLLDAV